MRRFSKDAMDVGTVSEQYGRVLSKVLTRC